MRNVKWKQTYSDLRASKQLERGVLSLAGEDIETANLVGATVVGRLGWVVVGVGRLGVVVLVNVQGDGQTSKHKTNDHDTGGQEEGTTGERGATPDRNGRLLLLLGALVRGSLSVARELLMLGGGALERSALGLGL